MPPLILLRFVSLSVYLGCIGLCLIWVWQNRAEWMYGAPALAIFGHAVLFYSFYLLDYFGKRGLPFDLQLYADWGSLFVLHVGFTSLFILLDLVTNVFTGWMARFCPPLAPDAHGMD